MNMRLGRRRLVRLLPFALGESALLAGCASFAAPGATPAAGVVPVSDSGAAPFLPARRDLGRRGSAKLEYANLPTGGTLNLLNLRNVSGFVSHLWLAINCADPNGREQSRYEISVDGEAEPSVRSTLVGFHAADDTPNTNFATRYVGYNHRDTLNGYFSYIPLPFRRSIKIDVVNGSSAAPATLFAIADYHVGGTLSWGAMGKLHTVEQDVSVAPYAWQDLLKVDRQPAGALWGVYLRFLGGDPSFGYLEGNVQMFADGSSAPSYESSGTEDYFNNAWYFQTGVIFADHSGCTRYDETTHAIGAYRFHVDDPIPFERSLQVRWQNGAPGQAAVANPTRIRSHVWYYTSE